MGSTGISVSSKVDCVGFSVADSRYRTGPYPELQRQGTQISPLPLIFGANKLYLLFSQLAFRRTIFTHGVVHVKLMIAQHQVSGIAAFPIITFVADDLALDIG